MMEAKNTKRRKDKENIGLNTDTGAVKPPTAPDSENPQKSNPAQQNNVLSIDIYNFIANHVKENITLHLSLTNKYIEDNRNELEKIREDLNNTKNIANTSTIKFDTLITWVKWLIGVFVSIIIAMVGYYLRDLNPKMNEMHTEIEKLKHQQVSENSNKQIESTTYIPINSRNNTPKR